MSAVRTSYVGALAALAASLITAVALIGLSADSPGEAITTFFVQPWTNRYLFGNLLSKAALLMLTASGVVLAFRSGAFNLGGEGQTYLGGLVAAMVLLAHPVPVWWAVPLAVLSGALAAAVLAGVSGGLRAWTGADELITSFLLSAGITPVIDYLIVGPLRDPTHTLLATPRVNPAYHLARILPPSQLTGSLVLALIVVIILWAVLRWTLFGYELSIVGYNRRMAYHGGIHLTGYTILPFAVSGLLHGLAGTQLVIGIHHRALAGFAGGLGWNGIAVALIARNHPLWIIPASLFFAFLDVGSGAGVFLSQTTWEFTAVIQGVVFLLVTVDHFRLRGARRGAT